jgi:hypothetical protein
VILRAVQVVVRSDFVEIRYQLGLHDNMILRELRALSAPGAAIPTDAAEAVARYRDVIAPLLPKRMRVTIDGNPVAMIVYRADIVRQPHRQLEIAYHIPFTPGTVPAKFVLWDDNFQGVPGYHFAAMRARGNAALLPIGADKPLDRLPSVPEPGQLASVPLEPMRGLAAYVCVAGVSPPAAGGPTPALAASPTVDAKKPSIPDTRPDDASPTQTVATMHRPDAAPATPAANRTLQRVVWPLSCGVVAVLLALAWWWTSRKPRKEHS